MEEMRSGQQNETHKKHRESTNPFKKTSVLLRVCTTETKITTIPYRFDMECEMKGALIYFALQEDAKLNHLV